MSNAALAPRRSALPDVPTRQDLEALGPADLWTFAERATELGELGVVAWSLNDERLRHWVEVEGKTQTEIAKLVGRDQSTISYRCAQLGIEIPKGKGTAGGRPKQVMDVHNPDDDAEEVDAEVVDEGDEGYEDVPLSPPPASGDRPMGVHFSSASDDWATPQDLFDQLDREFGFELDVCASDQNAKCAAYYTADQDGLAQPWSGTCWMNPPYGDVIGKWVAKARGSASDGATVVCLVPARVDTGWWWDYCLDGEIRFLKGRIRFGDAATGAPFPSALVILGPEVEPTVKWWRR